MAAAMEVCIDSVESAINAQKGGAIRVELCANLMEGGTTPSVGMLRVIKQKMTIPVFVMIRPRGGDFLYSEHEFSVMKENLNCLKKEGADGIVFGILTADGEVDRARCQEIIELSRPLPVTFHRAFDMVRDPFTSLDVLVELGVSRVLTSGLDSTVLEGLPTIQKLVKQANDQIIIMPGGGITERNLDRILRGSEAKEFHCSARESMTSSVEYRGNGSVFMGGALRPPEFLLKVTSPDKVGRFIHIANSAALPSFQYKLCF